MPPESKTRGSGAIARPLVPCESCNRHLRASDEQCPFCRVSRTSSKLALIAMSSAIVIGGCDTFTAGAKYGGPPPSDYHRDATTSTEEPGDAPSAPSATAPPSSTPSATAAPTTTSPRLEGTSDGGRLIAPSVKYGGPPRR